MPHSKLRSLWLLTATLALACAIDPNGPEPVTEQFWAAVAAGDFPAAAELCDGASAGEVRQLASAHPFDTVTVDDPLLGEGEARVPTHLVHEERTLTFDTYLVERGEEWRVDLRASRRALTRELLARSLEGIQEVVREGSEAFVEEFEARALEASEALRETLEELEESLRDPVAPPPPPSAPPPPAAPPAPTPPPAP